MCIQCDIYGKEGNRADALFLNDAANFFRVFFFATSLLCAGKSQSSLFLFYFILQILNLYSFGAEKKWDKNENEAFQASKYRRRKKKRWKKWILNTFLSNKIKFKKKRKKERNKRKNQKHSDNTANETNTKERVFFSLHTNFCEIFQKRIFKLHLINKQKWNMLHFHLKLD